MSQVLHENSKALAHTKHLKVIRYNNRMHVGLKIHVIQLRLSQTTFTSDKKAMCIEVTQYSSI